MDTVSSRRLRARFLCIVESSRVESSGMHVILYLKNLHPRALVVVRDRVAPGSLHESLGHDCLKAYVCILYASPCAPLLVLWPGEVDGTSLAMAQGKASPVPAPAPMFRVSAVLRRYDADVPPTAVGACAGVAPCTSMSVLPRRIVDLVALSGWC